MEDEGAKRIFVPAMFNSFGALDRETGKDRTSEGG